MFFPNNLNQYTLKFLDLATIYQNSGDRVMCYMTPPRCQIWNAGKFIGIDLLS